MGVFFDGFCGRQNHYRNNNSEFLFFLLFLEEKEIYTVDLTFY